MGQAAGAWREAHDGLAHAAETAERGRIGRAQVEGGRGRQKNGSMQRGAMRAWEKAMAAAGRAIEAASDYGGDLES